MRRYLISILFFLAFSTQSFAQAFIVLSYYVNTAPFAKACENKARPQLHCNGKCQMMKKVQEEEKKDEQSPERKSESRNEIALSSKSFAPLVPSVLFSQLKNKLPSFVSDGKSTDRSFAFFHPPKAC